MIDVAVIGGGPAGLYAARLLASAGYAVQVFEEHAAVGQPVHCTGVLAADAFQQFQLSRDCILNELSTARFIAPGGQQISYTTPATEAVVIDRPALDRALAASAVAAGATVHLGTRVRDLRPQDDAAHVDTDKGLVKARAVVLACGAHYRLHRRLGLGMPLVALNSSQLEVPAGRGGDVEVHFGGSVAPGGFAWTVPVSRPTGSYVRIGLMARGNGNALFRNFVDRVASSWGVPSNDIGEPHRRLLPLAPVTRSYAQRTIAVGDAAGLVKATTGGGIYYSLVSASIAADVLSAALRDNKLGAESLGRYQQLWRARLGSELRAQLALRMLAQRMSDSEIDAFFTLARTNGVMPLVRRFAAFNQHRPLIAGLFQHAPARRLLFRRWSLS